MIRLFKRSKGRRKLGFIAIERKVYLDHVHGACALLHNYVSRWVSLFRGGIENINNRALDKREYLVIIRDNFY